MELRTTRQLARQSQPHSTQTIVIGRRALLWFVCLLSSIQWYYSAAQDTLSDPAVFMMMEYQTNGTFKPLNNFTFSVHLQTVEMNVKVIGCQMGYFFARPAPDIECKQCVCAAYNMTMPLKLGSP